MGRKVQERERRIPKEVISTSSLVSFNNFQSLSYHISEDELDSLLLGEMKQTTE